MQDFLLNIDNKEILIEILHHSIDWMIGNCDDQQTLHLCHKYGFTNPDDFMLTIRTIARCYRNSCMEGGSEAELISEFANLNKELQSLVSTVLAARRPEIVRYLLRQQNAQDYPLVESFDWDARLVLGDSSFATNHQLLTTVTFNTKDHNCQSKTIHFQMDEAKLSECIKTLELALSDETKVSDARSSET